MLGGFLKEVHYILRRRTTHPRCAPLSGLNSLECDVCNIAAHLKCHRNIFSALHLERQFSGYQKIGCE